MGPTVADKDNDERLTGTLSDLLCDPVRGVGAEVIVSDWFFKPIYSMGIWNNPSE